MNIVDAGGIPWIIKRYKIVIPEEPEQEISSYRVSQHKKLFQRRNA
jgi:hypothetical protein